MSGRRSMSSGWVPCCRSKSESDKPAPPAPTINAEHAPVRELRESSRRGSQGLIECAQLRIAHTQLARYAGRVPIFAADLQFAVCQPKDDAHFRLHPSRHTFRSKCHATDCD